MRYHCALVFIVAAFLSAAARAQENPAETKIESKVESIGLFKNGLAVVRRSVDLGGAGTYRIDNVPTPVHGTFWITSPSAVSVMVTSRETDSPPRATGAIDFQEQLVGKQVTIHFRDGSIPPATGKVVQVTRATGNQAWNRTYQQPQYYYGNRDERPPGVYLILETPNGRIYADTSLIAHLAVESSTVKSRQPVLLLSVDKPLHATITYLTKGIAWAPAYRVNLDDAKTLTLDQQAVIKNEMEDFKDAELQLISGFPSIQFAHVISPLSLETNWANFFTQLNQRPGQGQDSSVMAQQAITINAAAPDRGVNLNAIPSREGVDLHYQSIGKRSMLEGDSLLVPTGQGKADYERIVEWSVPDTRDPDGRPVDWRERGLPQPERNEDNAWDAVRFKNPLPFPMTTAPALITASDRFNGQHQSLWVNTGEQTTLQITKALSIRTHSTEEEDQATGRQIVNIGGREYRKVTVKGELQAGNHRNEPITLVIKREFSGDLIRADENPKVTLSEEGVYSVNKRNVLNWSVAIPAGESKTLKYQYSVLIIN